MTTQPWGNNNRKLTDEQVLAMRKEYKAMGRSTQGTQTGIIGALARKYDVSHATASGIVHRKTYRHVGGY